MDNNSKGSQNLYSPEDLKNVIKVLWNQNIMWTRSYIISAISKLGDTEVVMNRLYENSRDFANIFKLYYGDKKANEFELLFRKHLTLTTQLVNNYIIGNESVITETDKQWYENANKLAVFLSQINPNWNKQNLQNLFKNYLDMTKDEILKRLNKQYAADVYLYDFIEYHALMIAEIMADGILKQFYH